MATGGGYSARTFVVEAGSRMDRTLAVCEGSAYDTDAASLCYPTDLLIWATVETNRWISRLNV